MDHHGVSQWNEEFFERFIHLRSAIYQNHPDFVSESLEDLRLFFGEDSGFHKTMSWKATVLERAGKPIARYLLSLRPGSTFLSLGFFECLEEDEGVKAVLFADIGHFFRKHPELREVKGPIQGSLVGGFRFREKTDAPRFLGESLHLDHYPDLWRRWGFVEEESWYSYALPLGPTRQHFLAMATKLGHLWQDPKIRTRGLNLRAWDQEVTRIFKITAEAYNITGTNHEVDETLFRALALKMRPLLSKQTVQMLDYGGTTVGFTICYPDIQNEIRRYNRRKKFWPAAVNSLLLYAGIQFRRHPLLLVYVAKTKECPIKWGIAKLAGDMAQKINVANYTGLISVLNADSSGSRASLPVEKTLHSRHFLMSLRPVP